MSDYKTFGLWLQVRSLQEASWICLPILLVCCGATQARDIGFRGDRLYVVRLLLLADSYLATLVFSHRIVRPSDTRPSDHQS